MTEPTTLFFSSDGFYTLEEGEDAVVRFLFDASAPSLPTADLKPGMIVWNGTQLTFLSQSQVETVKGVEINANSDTITIWTTAANTGRCSLVSCLQDPTMVPILALFTPTPENFCNFLKGLKQASTSTLSASQSSLLNSAQPGTPSTSAFSPVISAVNAVETFPESTPRKRKAEMGKPRKSKVKVVEKTSDQLRIERLEVLSKNHEVEESTFVYKPVTKLDVKLLQHDSTIRGLRMDFVNRLLWQMNNGLWIHDAVVLIVHKVGEQYFVLDGNHRLEAYMLYLQDKLKHVYQKVNCRVYDALTFDQILLVVKPVNTDMEKLHLTELQMAIETRCRLCPTSPNTS
uniref:ParB/Sulfiredoxin domain-containing protein n=1 Tax=Panagrolaimus davidi TaxID=227884 RepID=A0A914QVA0_9BILA